jgi:diguanylate cyclase (GGDEF)-like protein
MSWYVFVILLGLLGLAGLSGLTVLRDQVEERARNASMDTASVMVALTVHRNVSENSFGPLGKMAPAQVSALDRDVADLVSQNRLIGLELWRVDGEILYVDVDHPEHETVLPADELARAKKGKPWIDLSVERSVATRAVFIPYLAAAGAAPIGVVEVLMPDSASDRAVATTGRQLYALVVAVLLVAGLGLTTLRRRLVRREQEAGHDRLTGLMNWGGFRDAVEAAIHSGGTKGYRSSAVLLVDLDGFKSVNDTLGHPAGDTLLQQVGELIRSTVRTHDIVARMGGDEFAILLTGVNDPAAAVDAATQMLDRLHGASFEVEGISLGIEASIGITMATTEDTDVDVLLSRVDIAMYRAKRTGAGVIVYDNAFDRHDLRDLTLLGELRHAIDNNELILHYQPKANTATHDVSGVEALVRWNHPTRGLLTPAAFIPLAESTGLLGPLTQWVLSQAIADAAHWERGGLPLAVAVNISPRSLLHGDLPAAIVGLLSRHGLPSNLLEIEVTETAIMTDPDGASNVLRQLRTMGIRTSIDDFGSGYTSLAYLRALPVHALKIDRLLITDVMTDDSGMAVTQSIIDLGHRLGFSVLAEGVETEEAWHQLDLLGCDELQGYVLARPMPAAQIEGWITTHQHALGPTHVRSHPIVQ